MERPRRLLAALPEVIPMRSRAYRSVVVNQPNLSALAADRDGQDVVVGFDVGKFDIFAVLRWPDRHFERPWRIANPDGIPEFLGVLGELARRGRLTLAMEPSGTYGDALRQALHDAGLALQRVSPKAAHDYAEVFDGVPSQHDGKDAAVVAELAAIGKGKIWEYPPASASLEQARYWVERLDWHQRVLVMGLGQIEALLARHWPEATRLLPLSRSTLLRVLAEYGGPQRLAEDASAAVRVQQWGGKRLEPAKVAALLESAATTRGVRPSVWEMRRLREQASAALAAQREVRCCRRQLQAVVEANEGVRAQAEVVGSATACVLWVGLGEPRRYDSAKAYRKAMGLNLVERSSGTYQGQLRISKRGSARVRRWLYLASVRLIKRAGVRRWYEAKKGKDRCGGKRAVVAVMRKLALALYHVGVGGERFEVGRLFGRKRRPAGRQ
jgi:transposase